VGAKAYGRILAWEGASLWLLGTAPGERYPRTDVHAHHAIQLTIALRGEVELDTEAGRVSGTAFAIAPDAPHAFAGTDAVAHLFVDPDGHTGRAMTRTLLSAGPIAPVPLDRLGELPACLRDALDDPRQTDDAVRALGRELAARLADGPSPLGGQLDPRIAKLTRWAASHLDETPSLSEIASVAGLSKSRTRHLFVAETGLPFRTYLLWLRLVRALELFAAGASLTEAAHGAGFADSAHLSRTFRRMFGISAATLRLS
jgi:AraC family transcriptional regulator